MLNKVLVTLLLIGEYNSEIIQSNSEISENLGGLLKINCFSKKNTGFTNYVVNF